MAISHKQKTPLWRGFLLLSLEELFLTFLNFNQTLLN